MHWEDLAGHAGLKMEADLQLPHPESQENELFPRPSRKELSPANTVISAQWDLSDSSPTGTGVRMESFDKDMGQGWRLSSTKEELRPREIFRLLV